MKQEIEINLKFYFMQKDSIWEHPARCHIFQKIYHYMNYILPYLKWLSLKRKSNQSILKEISPGCSLEGQMLKLKLQYFGHLVRRVDSLEKTLMLGGIGGRRRSGWQRMRWLDGITNWWMWVWVNSRSWWWTGRPGVLRFMGSQRVGHDWATQLTELTELTDP